MTDFIKLFFARLGLFVARLHPGLATGHELKHDLKAIIRHDAPVCFDIGANRGQTIRFLQTCFRHPVIHAVEPASASWAILQKQAFGPTVHLHQLAMGEQVGEQEFINYGESELSSFLALNRNETENFFARQPVESLEMVQIDTLDHFCEQHGIQHIDLLKIDTQGFELPVLRGGARLFARRQVGAVLLELNFAQLYENQSDALDILRFLRDHELQLVDYYEKERVAGIALSWTTALFVRLQS